MINQIRGFLIERGIIARQGVVPLRKALSEILSSQTDSLSPRMIGLVTDLVQDWRRLDERIAAVSAEIEALAEQDESCQRLMTVPGVGPIISSAVVAAIGNGAGFKQGRDFRRLAGARAEAGVDGGSHHPGQDLQARQQVPEDAVRAGRADDFRHHGTDADILYSLGGIFDAPVFIFYRQDTTGKSFTRSCGGGFQRRFFAAWALRIT